MEEIFRKINLYKATERLAFNIISRSPNMNADEFGKLIDKVNKRKQELIDAIEAYGDLRVVGSLVNG